MNVELSDKARREWKVAYAQNDAEALTKLLMDDIQDSKMGNLYKDPAETEAKQQTTGVHGSM